MINVTKTFLPPQQEYNNIVKRAWDKIWLTNRGEIILELEEKLKHYLTIDNIIITNNGTIPIQIALKLLGNCGEIITTPFSYVATSAAIVWENCKPIFVDIHPEYLTIDETKIEAAITSKTTAILATHVFGNPCHVEAIEAIAKKYHLKVIYDAAHSFGVTYKNQSIFNFGDVSTCSFHATKLFHTGEGGAMFCKDKNLHDKLFYSHNFGHNGPLDFHGLGINAKISELQAAMGLAVFPHMDFIINERKKVVEFYNSGLNFNLTKSIKIRENTNWNYSYYPLIFDNEATLLKVQSALNDVKIFPRRYFYPSLNTIEYIKGDKMPVSESVASRILCLPLYVGLMTDELEKIVLIINTEIC
jgi:dTDP-4-amino-4,6-dideoxygalactose transaminase